MEAPLLFACFQCYQTLLSLEKEIGCVCVLQCTITYNIIPSQEILDNIRPIIDFESTLCLRYGVE